MNDKNTLLLGQMNVKKALITLSVPAMIGMIVNATYNLVDSLFVGWGAGETAIGGLTLAFPVQMIVMAVALMIGIGGASVFSRAYGENKYEKMHSTFNTAIRFGVISGAVISVLGLLFLTPMLEFFGATDGNIGFAQDYLGVILFGVTFQSISMILNNFTRAEGRAKVAMISMVVGTGLNIILDPIFIFDWGLGLGVKGAALATIISQIISAMYIIYRTFDEDSKLKISLTKFFEFDKEALAGIIKIGFPTFVRNALGAFLAILILKMIAYYSPIGDVDMNQSIYGVINRLTMFILMPGFGLVQGLAPIAGFNFGAKKWGRLVDVTKFATIILTAYFIGGFLFIQFGATMIFDVFSSDNNQLFIENGARMFRIISLAFGIVSFQIISGALYQAFGYAKRALFISLSRQFLFFIPISFILTSIFGLDGLWFTFAVADLLSGIIGLGMLLYEVKVLKRNANADLIT
jgi:putative MATE family efflux protein